MEQHEMEKLAEAGICSFKIEGRMKSGYYLATVINAYRRRIDGLELETCENELSAVAHREYTTAYAFGKNTKTVHYEHSQSKGDCVYIADVVSWADGYAVVEMRNRFLQGDTLEILSPNAGFLQAFPVEEIYTQDGERTDDAKLVCHHYKISCPVEVFKGDYLRRRV